MDEDVPEFRIEGLDTTVLITKSGGSDGATVVFIDTTYEPSACDGGPGLRVLINDFPAYEGKPWRPLEEADLDG